MDELTRKGEEQPTAQPKRQRSPRKGKQSAEQVDQRVQAVYEALLDGASRYEILQFATDAAWDLSERTVDYYIAKAREWIATFAKPQRKKLLQEHIAARRRIRAKANAKGDLWLALAAQQDEARLLGLYDYETNKRLERIERELGISTDIPDEKPAAQGD